MKTLPSTLALAGFAVLLAACNDYPPPTPLPAEYTTCETPADCVPVELGCCDSCNGGRAVAVNADQADAVMNRYSEACGLGTRCTELGCPPWVVDCVAGTCTMEPGSF